MVEPGLIEDGEHGCGSHQLLPAIVSDGVMFSAEMLSRIMPAASGSAITRYVGGLNHHMGRSAISTPLRAAHFIAQLAHESGSLRHSFENLNYSSSALRSTFARHFPTEELASE